MRDARPVAQKGQDIPWTGPVERGSVAAPCPPGSCSPSSPALRVPFPILTPCLMPCPRPDSVLISLTRTRAHTVCLITMSVSGHRGAMGSHPGGRQVSVFPGRWERGGGRVRHWSTHQCPPAFQVLHTPIPAPPAMPASRTHGAEGLDPAKDRTWGCILGLHSASLTRNRARLRGRAARSSEHVSRVC